MGATLDIANQKNAYTISDRATYLASQKSHDLAVLLAKDPVLLNIYHVIEVNPARHKINEAGAKAFADFVVGPQSQEIIRNFGVAKFGQPLFFPDAGKSESSLASN